jgi:hypothetical protein
MTKLLIGRQILIRDGERKDGGERRYKNILYQIDEQTQLESISLYQAGGSLDQAFENQIFILQTGMITNLLKIFL